MLFCSAPCCVALKRPHAIFSLLQHQKMFFSFFTQIWRTRLIFPHYKCARLTAVIQLFESLNEGLVDQNHKPVFWGKALNLFFTPMVFSSALQQPHWCMNSKEFCVVAGRCDMSAVHFRFFCVPYAYICIHVMYATRRVCLVAYIKCTPF